MPPTTSIFDDETLLNSSQQRAFFGGVSEMWLTRRERERAEAERRKPGSGFPLPRIIAGRKYRTLGDLRRYRDAQPQLKIVESDAPRPPVQSREAKAKRAVRAAAESSTAES
jgi:hypothetical protein